MASRLKRQRDALMVENDMLKIVLKHVLKDGRHILMTVEDLEAAAEMPNIRFVEDHGKNELVVTYDDGKYGELTDDPLSQLDDDAEEDET